MHPRHHGGKLDGRAKNGRHAAARPPHDWDHAHTNPMIDQQAGDAVPWSAPPGANAVPQQPQLRRNSPARVDIDQR